MTVRIADMVVDSSDPERAATFWCAALGYRITDRDETGVAIAGSLSAPTMLFLTSTDTKLHKNRLHFDVCPVDGSTRDEEVARLERLGARRAGADDARSWVVMHDPDGNEFCVMDVVVPPEPEPFRRATTTDGSTA